MDSGQLTIDDKNSARCPLCIVNCPFSPCRRVAASGFIRRTPRPDGRGYYLSAHPRLFAIISNRSPLPVSIFKKRKGDSEPKFPLVVGVRPAENRPIAVK
jgi:hypothetical protein